MGRLILHNEYLFAGFAGLLHELLKDFLDGRGECLLAEWLLEQPPARSSVSGDDAEDGYVGEFVFGHHGLRLVLLYPAKLAFQVQADLCLVQKDQLGPTAEKRFVELAVLKPSFNYVLFRKALGNVFGDEGYILVGIVGLFEDAS